MKLYRVTLPFAVFGFETSSGFVSRVAPIAGYALGWSEARAVGYFGKRGKVERVGP